MKIGGIFMLMSNYIRAIIILDSKSTGVYLDYFFIV
jgi:hypothetical protein